MAPNSLSLIRRAPKHTDAAPLVLLHDGGGTVYSYHMLSDLGRDVFGIANPRLDDGGSWDGGVPEMAEAYASMIRASVPAGDVLLGGWSFGGLLSMEICRLFKEDPTQRIVGLVLIDVPYPKSLKGEELVGINHMPSIPGVRPRLRAKIHTSLRQARSMIAAWQLPASPPSLPSISPGSDTDTDADFDDNDLHDSVYESTICSRKSCSPLPPAVLLRAIDPVRSDSYTATDVALVDVFRHDAMLGWRSYNDTFVQAVWELPGNHFSLFDAIYVKDLSAKLDRACQFIVELDTDGKRRKGMSMK